MNRIRFTPLKTNMSPENQWLEDVFPTEIVPFSGDMLVFGGVYMPLPVPGPGFLKSPFPRPGP